MISGVPQMISGDPNMIWKGPRPVQRGAPQRARPQPYIYAKTRRGRRPVQRVGPPRGGEEETLPLKTIIMAGGKGTRIAEIARDIPKPMIPIRGKPVLEYQIEALLRSGMEDITVVVGHLGDAVKSYFDKGPYKRHIRYFTETEPLGTAGALFKLIGELGDSFFLINGDLIFDVDFSRIEAFHRSRDALATLVSHPNSHPYDSALLVSDGEGRVIRWINKEEPRLYYKNRVNTGIHILTRELILGVQKDLRAAKVDLDRDILKGRLSTGRIFAYDTPEYIKDMGTPDRYYQVERDLERGLVSSRNLANPQRAVFLDRDGTINTMAGFVTTPEDFALIPGAAEAIRRINDLGYLAIVITNQPVIARGQCSLEELETIHQKMESDLGKEGAYVDDLFFCPHHPDKGFPGERPEYKIDCECRKPKPGLILRAAKKYNIDLSQSYMVGDHARDIQAGIAAGVKPVLITGKAERPAELGGNAVLTVSSLKEFAETYLREGAPPPPPLKVAVVHYWLINMRGGEKMLEALLELFPEADLYTHVYDHRGISASIKTHRVYTSSINRLPFARRLYRNYMPLMPNALKEFDLGRYDLVISSEAGPAKGVVVSPDAYHLCYCHSPMRYIWDLYHDYLRESGPLVRFFMKRLVPSLRAWDMGSANLVDRFITNSSYVAKRIGRYYRREAAVVFGPADIGRFLARARAPEDFYLFFGQLVGYKRADIAIEACIETGRRLVVAGAGARKRDLRRYEKSGLVSFTGRLEDDEVADYFSRARALLFPGIEDLGLIPIEANAAGCPVIAYRKGGALDTVKENETGIFFDEQSPASLIQALDAFEAREADFAGREQFTRQVQQFSKEAFIRRIERIVAERKRI